MRTFSPDRAYVQKYKTEFPVGTRVELVLMKDTQAPPVGTKGTVTGVDDMATIHVAWDNGSCLGVAFMEDQCKKI